MAEDLSEILETSEHTLLATGLGATEGPLWHRDGYLTFVDLQGSRLLRWDAGFGVSVVRENTGEGNGCTLERQGRLIMCEGANRRVTRTEIPIPGRDADVSVVTIAERWEGKRLHRPNDVVCRSDGSIYFTDPSLRVPPEEQEYGFGGVFRIAPDGQLHLATDGCEYPNGLAFSPDESVLYVAISRTGEQCFREEEAAGSLRPPQDTGLRRGRRRRLEQQSCIRRNVFGRAWGSRRGEGGHRGPGVLRRLWRDLGL